MFARGRMLGVTTALVVGLLVPPNGAPAVAQPVAAGAGKSEIRLRDAVRKLSVDAERRRGYDRDKFEHWTDADADCYDTRDEVLDAESRTNASGSSCDISSGRWFSYYDHATWTSSGDVDIDHLVPLAEAWDSGARGWNRATRRRFANDLGDRRSLAAVTDNVNQSKNDQDVADWLPPRRDERCRYVREWVAVKLRWSLRVDRPEVRVLRTRAADCRNLVLRLRIARVELRG